MRSWAQEIVRSRAIKETERSGAHIMELWVEGRPNVRGRGFVEGSVTDLEGEGAAAASFGREQTSMV